jgi:hypothetical protein
MHFRWMSDEQIGKLRAESFWRSVFLRGVLQAGTAFAVGLVVLGLIWRTPQAFTKAWWMNGLSMCFVLGFVWALVLWMSARFSSKLREFLYWMLAIAVLVGIGMIVLLR